MIEDAVLSVKVGNGRGDAITTNVGTPQGDCLSPTLFTLYLSKAITTDQHLHKNRDHTQQTDDIVTMLFFPPICVLL